MLTKLACLLCLVNSIHLAVSELGMIKVFSNPMDFFTTVYRKRLEILGLINNSTLETAENEKMPSEILKITIALFCILSSFFKSIAGRFCDYWVLILCFAFYV